MKGVQLIQQALNKFPHDREWRHDLHPQASASLSRALGIGNHVHAEIQGALHLPRPDGLQVAKESAAIVSSTPLRARAEEAVLEESPWKRGSIAPLSRTTRTRLLALPGGETEELGRSTETEARPAREMAALVKVVIHCTREPHWISLCNGLIPTLAQQQWGRLLHASLQRHNNGQFQLTKVCCDLIQSIRTIKQPNRTFHDTKIFRSSAQPSEEKVGTFTKIIEAMGFTGPLKYRKWKIRIAALRMYTCCVDKIDYEEFFNKLQIPDTFNSWFLIVQLHVWMCLVRMKQEGRAGKYMCYYIVYAMWEDAEQRGKVMGVNSLILKRSLRTLTEVFYASIFGYDEGILSDDHVLAAAIWRNLFETNCSDPRQLAMMVEYVRKQVQHLDAMSGEDLLLSGEVTWRPLMEPNPQSIVKPVSPVYNDEGL